MPDRIIDLTADRLALIDQAARLLHDAFRNRTESWPDLESARQGRIGRLLGRGDRR